jgi:hypothetical protein
MESLRAQSSLLQLPHHKENGAASTATTSEQPPETAGVEPQHDSDSEAISVDHHATDDADAAIIAQLDQDSEMRTSMRDILLKGGGNVTKAALVDSFEDIEVDSFVDEIEEVTKAAETK